MLRQLASFRLPGGLYTADVRTRRINGVRGENIREKGTGGQIDRQTDRQTDTEAV